YCVAVHQHYGSEKQSGHDQRERREKSGRRSSPDTAKYGYPAGQRHCFSLKQHYKPAEQPEHHQCQRCKES
ncbi:TPA: hypothetical protein ACQ2HR_005164, partial [Klebsiella pneumoniae]